MDLPEIKLRPATSADSKFFFDLRNEPHYRAMSISTDEVSWSSHQTWFENALSDQNRDLRIIESEDEPIGILRLDYSPGSAPKLTIALDAGQRGKGIGSIAIKKGTSLAFRQGHGEVLADVKEENASSIRAFEKAGYEETTRERGLITLSVRSEKYE